MHFRPATIDDADMLLAWRNDSETRRQSNRTKPVEPGDWRAEIAAKISKETLLVAEIDGVPVGTIGIKENELSWTVAPEYRRRGIGKEMVAAVARSGHIARIKKTNIASQRIAMAVGFLLVSDGKLQKWLRR